MVELPIVSTGRHLSGPLIDHLARRLRTESEAELERFGLRARHLIALTLLRGLGARPQAELAQLLSIDPTNVVGLLNELESDGLVERHRSPEDRRRHTVALTQAGREKLDAVEDVLITVERRVLSSLDDYQRGTLHALLQRAVGEADGQWAGHPAEDVVRLTDPAAVRADARR
ncbi:MarR family winged helix-turn-helix transcriptional regulator [Mycolicibacterium arenosum]|uniref:MarR family transcriptional regulator n=1 Tax=Mycolicibacterium arenosum TaxID=2952157 RepID=A0ABT1M1C3_9MYCO|nr:MarR family transcriptional regulator [Mycolicibacterium sp. CAU 1645]MCP9272252.1 MarR family transcriptional regulator [Mycolicibacterium sp. CAU 1645]